MTISLRTLGLIAAAALLTPVSCLLADDYYVSATRGKGRKGTMEQPAKDLGNLISKLEAGDTVHIASGTYLGRGENGTDIITVPVSIIGGYADDFSSRDPWGTHRTILSGNNLSKNWDSTGRLVVDLSKYREKDMPAILIDGVIVDNAGRNRYSSDELQLVRSANPKAGQNPTPTTGGISVSVSKTGNLDGAWDITIQNCVVLNVGASQGALTIRGHKGTTGTVRNNLVVNNTGTGIFASTAYRPSSEEGWPQYTIENNTVLFTWKFDAAAQSYSGNSIKLDPQTRCTVKNNVFAFADKFGVHNAARAPVLLENNNILGNVEADYLEFDTRIALDDMEDEAEHIHEDTTDNVSEPVEIAIGGEWVKLWAGRILIDRNAAEADIQAQQSAANEIRAMLGLPLQAGTVDMPESPVWLHRLSVDDAIKAGSKQYDGRGASFPGRVKAHDPIAAMTTNPPAEIDAPMLCAQVYGGTRSVSMPIELPGLEGYLYSRACQGAVGGDIHYLSICGSGVLSRFCVADVVGHGEEVSIVSAETHTLLRQSMNQADHRRALGRLNRVLVAKGLNSLTTAALFTYFPPTRQLTFSYAGHPRGWRRSGGRGAWSPLLLPDATDLGLQDLPLAVAPETTYSRGRIKAGVDDLIIITTDGVTDAPDTAMKRLGSAGFERLLDRIETSSPQSAVESMVEGIATHCGSDDFTHDDITVLALRIRPFSRLGAVRAVLANRLLRPLLSRPRPA